MQGLEEPDRTAQVQALEAAEAEVPSIPCLDMAQALHVFLLGCGTRERYSAIDCLCMHDGEVAGPRAGLPSRVLRLYDMNL